MISVSERPDKAGGHGGVGRASPPSNGTWDSRGGTLNRDAGVGFEAADRERGSTTWRAQQLNRRPRENDYLTKERSISVQREEQLGAPDERDYKVTREDPSPSQRYLSLKGRRQGGESHGNDLVSVFFGA